MNSKLYYEISKEINRLEGDLAVVNEKLKKDKSAENIQAKELILLELKPWRKIMNLLYYHT